MQTFRQARIEEQPKYLADPQGNAYQGALGDVQDAELRKLKDVVQMRNPADCPDDGLDALGRFYVLPRFNAESHDGYRGRLSVAFETYKLAGTKAGVIASLKAFGIEDVAVYEDWEGHFAPGDWYSRVWVVLGPKTPWAPLVAPFVTPCTGGTTATIAEVHSVKKQILRWKDGGAYPVNIIIRFDGAILGNINSTPPFTPPADGGVVIVWKLGPVAPVVPEYVPGYQV